MLFCAVYVLFILTVTVLWTYYGRHWPFQLLTLVMFFPGLFAPWFVEDPEFYSTVLGLGKLSDVGQHAIIAGLIAMVQLVVIVFLMEIVGWGKTVNNPAEEIRGIPNFVAGFLQATGEEIGWRSFLLPCLLSHFALIPAVLISGIICGLYHVPLIVLCMRRLALPNLHRTVVVHFMSFVLSAFIYSWVAIKSGFCFLAPALMNFTWKRLNPVATGNIYLNTPGKLRGPQWLINAEGLAGCMIQLPCALLVIYNLRMGPYALY